jgi:hypothetical protein
MTLVDGSLFVVFDIAELAAVTRVVTKSKCPDYYADFTLATDLRLPNYFQFGHPKCAPD